MKKLLLSAVILGAGVLSVTSCEKEQPAEDMSGTYTGLMTGVLDGNDTIMQNYQVLVSSVSKNKVAVEGSTFPTFEVLVTKEGINVKAVSTDDEVKQFLYQGNDQELSFKFYKNGDSSIYQGFK